MRPPGRRQSSPRKLDDIPDSHRQSSIIERHDALSALSQSKSVFVLYEKRLFVWNDYGMEHRWGERVRVDFPVRITALRFSMRDGRLADLSVSGALLKTVLDLRVLSRIQIAIVMPLWPKHDAPLVEAYVARKYRDGFGVEWCEFAPPAVTRLLSATVNRPYANIRRPTPTAAVTISRLSAPLLRHSA
jgi:hypothetical protein